MVDFVATPLFVPIYQILMMLLASTLALLFGKVRLALIINYLFTMYWGYILNKDVLVGDGIGSLDFFTAIYFVLGLAVVILAVFGFLASRHNKC